MISFKIEGQLYNIEGENVEAIALFGSFARGDYDASSDIDILIIIEDCDEKYFVDIKEKLVEQLNVPSDWVSVYRKKTIQEMYEFGSYFLWHIKVEGKILFSRSKYLEDILNNLPLYRRARQDLLDYQQICNDVRSSVKKDFNTLFYEFAVLASLVRNTCITLSYVKGKKVFGRKAPVIACQEILGEDFPFTLEEYNELYKYRINYTRENNLVVHQDDNRLIYQWIDKVKRLIEIALDILEGSDSNVQ